MYGEVGLLMLFLEAGLDVDLEMLKLVGARGLMLSMLACCVALGLGTLISHLVLGNGWVESFGVGATLAPTSMGIALNVLRSCRSVRLGGGGRCLAFCLPPSPSPLLPTPLHTPHTVQQGSEHPFRAADYFCGHASRCYWNYTSR